MVSGFGLKGLVGIQATMGVHLDFISCNRVSHSSFSWVIKSKQINATPCVCGQANHNKLNTYLTQVSGYGVVAYLFR